MPRERKRRFDAIDADGLIAQAAKKGLELGNPIMVKIVHEIMEQEETEEKFENILQNLNITHYEIPDTSMREIVLKAPDYVIDEIRAALIERETQRLVDMDGRD